jgi:hypothetical protein
MPLYVVRWPDLSVALVRAANDDELFEIIDEVADPGGCTWAEYDGPVFLEFELAAHVEVECPEPGANGAHGQLYPEQIHIVDADKLADRQVAPMIVSPAGDSGYEMLQAVARFAFPTTAAAYWDSEHEPDRETMEHALRTDTLRLVELTWRQGHAHRDPAAPLAIDLDASMHRIKSQCENLVTLARNANEAAEHVLGLATNGMDQQAPENGPDPLIASLDAARAAWLKDRAPGAVRKLLLQALLQLEEQR